MTNHHVISPFPGLRPFKQDEDYLFFGREEQTMELLQRLSNNRFLAVVGTSGSGKSSLVRCGLLSELQGGKMLRAGASWEIAVTQPGGNPLGLLAEALLEAELYDPDEPDAREQLLATLTRSHFGLVEAVRQAHLGEDVNILLVVDQFEEIFRFNEAGQTQEEAANEFVSLLLEAASQTAVPIYVVLTMRSDFIGDCSQFEGLAEIVNRGEFLIPRLTREQYKRVIEAPIRVAGGEITPRLLQRLLNDLGQQADQLPCLQHALMRTWDLSRQRGDDEPLDLDDYRLAGGMTQALSLHADEVYESLANDDQRRLCGEIFRALTVRETENRGIRRPQRLHGLCEILETAASELTPIIDAFREQGVTFLMPPPDVELSAGTIIDISHESLMRVWTRLRHWVDEEFEAAGIYRRLSENAALFEQNMTGLYRDPELGIALSWRDNRRPNEAWARRYHDGFSRAMQFLEESEATARRAEREREEAHHRELQQAQQLAEQQRLRADDQKRAAGRFRWLSLASAAITVLAIIGFFIAAAARKKAESSETAAITARGEAISEAKKAESARVTAVAAGKAETEQRKRAETQHANALAAQQQLKVALDETSKAKTAAEKASMQAQTSQKKAELAQAKAEAAEKQARQDRRTAQDAESRAVADRKRAEQERQLAVQSAALAKRRERLFEKLLPLLQDHAADGVAQYAQQLRDDNQPRLALETFVDFCNLVMGEQQPGALARELLDLSDLDLQGVDNQAIQIKIRVPAASLFAKVLSPAIELADAELAKSDTAELRGIVAQLHVYRAQLLKQPNVEWPSNVVPATLVFESFDRAAQLQPMKADHFVGRAAARFRLKNPDLMKTKTDLEKALQLTPKPAAADTPPNDGHRQLARLHHARANVLEYLAQADHARSQQWLGDAEKSQRAALALDATNSRYLVGVARTVRKLRMAQPRGLRQGSLEPVEKLLLTSLKLNQDDPVTHNELGEVYLLKGQLKNSRQSFENAIKHGKIVGNRRRLGNYYCNLASACLRDDTAEGSIEAALDAADKAIALQTDFSAEGLFYRGLALWKLKRNGDALQAFSNSVRLDAGHIGALLSRSQIIFEMDAPNAAGPQQLEQARRDVANILARADLSTADRAKANYVSSIGWLKKHLSNKSEDALVRCLDFALKAARASTDYKKFAADVFQHAGRTSLRDKELEKMSLKLQQEFKLLQLD